ncbi:MAG: hypothetical protein DHS80DRAFT_23651 [Piptocephalis tieghemiana]|nr:MAG: hypothetical protein DHS80DRAFT_23651 [Piptocephalis tieghemiana]
MLTIDSLPTTVSTYLEAQPMEARSAIVKALLALAVDILTTGEVEGEDVEECRTYSVYPDWWGERPRSSKSKTTTPRNIRWVCTDPTGGPWSYPPRKVDRSTQTSLDSMASSSSPPVRVSPHPPLPPAVYFTVPSRTVDTIHETRRQGPKERLSGGKTSSTSAAFHRRHCHHRHPGSDKSGVPRDGRGAFKRHSLPTVRVNQEEDSIHARLSIPASGGPMTRLHASGLDTATRATSPLPSPRVEGKEERSRVGVRVTEKDESSSSSSSSSSSNHLDLTSLFSAHSPSSSFSSSSSSSSLSSSSSNHPTITSQDEDVVGLVRSMYRTGLLDSPSPSLSGRRRRRGEKSTRKAG